MEVRVMGTSCFSLPSCVWPAFGWDRGLWTEIWSPPGAHPGGEVCRVHPPARPEWRRHLPTAWAGQPGEAAQRCFWCWGAALLWQVAGPHHASPCLMWVGGPLSTSWATGLKQMFPRPWLATKRAFYFAGNLCEEWSELEVGPCWAVKRCLGCRRWDLA